MQTIVGFLFDVGAHQFSIGLLEWKVMEAWTSYCFTNSATSDSCIPTSHFFFNLVQPHSDPIGLCGIHVKLSFLMTGSSRLRLNRSLTHSLTPSYSATQPPSPPPLRHFATSPLRHSATHPLTPLPIHRPTHSLTHSFTYSIIPLHLHFLIYSLAQSFSHSVTQSLSHAVTQSLSRPVAQAPTRSLSHTFGQSVAQSLTHSSTTDLPIHPPMPLLTRSLSHPPTRSLAYSITLAHSLCSFCVSAFLVHPFCGELMYCAPPHFLIYSLAQ